MIIYQIIGNPVPWAAPGRKGNFYFNPKDKEKKQAVWQLKPQISHSPLSGPLRVDVFFHMPIPKSTSGIRKRQMLNGVIHHISKPDRSNLLKFVEDCLQDAEILSNDSIIVCGETKKIYGEEPKTVIIIQELNVLLQKLGT